MQFTAEWLRSIILALPGNFFIVFDTKLLVLAVILICMLHIFGHYYAPNFEKIGGAYCFSLSIRACIRSFVTLFVPLITSESCMPRTRA